MVEDMRVYIANLGKYNEGYLVGDWFSFLIDEEDVAERIGLNEQYEEYADVYKRQVKDNDPRCLSAAGVPVCVLHGKSGQHPDDQSAGKAAGDWDFAVCGHDRKAGFPYADCRMPVVCRGYGVTVGWYRRNPRLDFGLCDQQF